MSSILYSIETVGDAMAALEGVPEETLVIPSLSYDQGTAIWYEVQTGAVRHDARRAAVLELTARSESGCCASAVRTVGGLRDVLAKLDFNTLISPEHTELERLYVSRPEDTYAVRLLNDDLEAAARAARAQEARSGVATGDLFGSHQEEEGNA